MVHVALYRLIALASLAAASAVPACASAGVLDIREFGARANDGRDDARALAKALSVARSGDVVTIPAGQFDIGSSVNLPSGIVLRGEGCGRSVLRRVGPRSGQIMLKLDGVERTGISAIEFDFNSAPEFYRAIGFQGAGSKNIRISENCFYERNFAGGRGDRWAIELSATKSANKNITVARNQSDGNIQLTAGGGAGVIGLLIDQNVVRNARSNGIAVSTLAQRPQFRNIVISNNIIQTPTAIGIYIGPDKPQNGGGVFDNISIVGNQVLGLRNRYTYGIFLRAPEGGMSSVTVSGNSLDGRGSPEAIAIRLLDDHGKGSRQFSKVHMCNNKARNFGRGIWLQRVFGAVVSRNEIESGRPFIASPKENKDIKTGGSC